MKRRHIDMANFPDDVYALALKFERHVPKRLSLTDLKTAARARASAP
jgi:hypothetical protein